MGKGINHTNHTQIILGIILTELGDLYFSLLDKVGHN